MKLIPANRFIRDATTAVKKARKRVALIAITVLEEPQTQPLFDAIRAAGERGVKITILADTFTYTEKGTILPTRRFGKGARNIRKTVESLKKAGVDFQWLGVVRPTILHGRTHHKWLVVDDTVYTFGGINILDKALTNNDYQFKLLHRQLANRLEYEMTLMVNAEKERRQLPDTSYAMDGSTVMFDGGTIGRSIIYDRACELARDAKEILYVSQHCPTGKLARIISRKKSHVFFNRPAQASSFNKPLIWFSIALSGMRNRYKKAPYIHAKFAIFTMADGSKTAITGSHNLTYAGVVLGTREIALETRNPKVTAQLEAFAEKYIY